MNTENFKCENCCSNVDNCFDLRPWFKCGHIQCKRTTISIFYCIRCGNNERVELFAHEQPPLHNEVILKTDDDQCEADEDESDEETDEPYNGLEGYKAKMEIKKRNQKYGTL